MRTPSRLNEFSQQKYSVPSNFVVSSIVIVSDEFGYTVFVFISQFFLVTRSGANFSHFHPVEILAIVSIDYFRS